MPAQSHKYTLSLDDTFPRPVIDLKKSGRLSAYACTKELLLDTDNLTLWGESAGGHLALEAALLSRMKGSALPA